MSNTNNTSAELFSTAIYPTDNNQIISFCAGAVNWTMPTTWPFIISGLDLTTLGAQLQPIAEYLQIILNVASTVTSPLYAVLHPVLALIDSTLAATHLAFVPDLATLLTMLTRFTGYANEPAVKLKLNSTIGLANVGTQIQLGDVRLDIWGGIVAGPPYPVVMPRDGVITRFEADLDALAVVNPQQLINIIPGFSELISALEIVLGLIASVVNSMSFLLKPILDALLAPLGLSSSTLPLLPDFGTDFSKTLFAEGDTIEVRATLWKVDSILGPSANTNIDPTTGAYVPTALELKGMHNSLAGSTPIAEICLGGIELAHLAAWDATTSLPGTALSAIASVLGLNGGASQIDASENGQFAVAMVELPVPVAVSEGDSLMVEFSIVSPQGIDLAVGIAAPNVSANITYI